jgi:hypothetical protein
VTALGLYNYSPRAIAGAFVAARFSVFLFQRFFGEEIFSNS